MLFPAPAGCKRSHTWGLGTAQRSLKLGDGKFRSMFDEYHQLDDEICRIEENVEFATDQHIDELKFKRARLKDALFAAVQKHDAAAVR